MKVRACVCVRACVHVLMRMHTCACWQRRDTQICVENKNNNNKKKKNRLLVDGRHIMTREHSTKIHFIRSKSFRCVSRLEKKKREDKE